ncbi:hypothetical protein J26TS2_12960 [Shouchella clausii]|nr:hypothetical protein J26TS2_12960 [Shouchella clausii]
MFRYKRGVIARELGGDLGHIYTFFDAAICLFRRGRVFGLYAVGAIA